MVKNLRFRIFFLRKMDSDSMIYKKSIDEAYAEEEQKYILKTARLKKKTKIRSIFITAIIYDKIKQQVT